MVRLIAAALVVSSLMFSCLCPLVDDQILSKPGTDRSPYVTFREYGLFFRTVFHDACAARPPYLRPPNFPYAPVPSRRF